MPSRLDSLMADPLFAKISPHEKRVLVRDMLQSEPEWGQMLPGEQEQLLGDMYRRFPDPGEQPAGGGAYSGMDPEFSRRLQQMVADSGGRLKITDGYRTYNQQWQAFQNKPTKAWDPRKGPGPHMRGIAADLDGDLGWAHKNAAKYGLRFPMLVQAPGKKYEPWHVQIGHGLPQTGPQFTAERSPYGERGGSANLVMNPLDSAQPFWQKKSLPDLLAAGTDKKRGVTWRQHVREILANPRSTNEELAWIRELVARKQIKTGEIAAIQSRIDAPSLRAEPQSREVNRFIQNRLNEQSRQLSKGGMDRFLNYFTYLAAMPRALDQAIRTMRGGRGTKLDRAIQKEVAKLPFHQQVMMTMGDRFLEEGLYQEAQRSDEAARTLPPEQQMGRKAYYMLGQMATDPSMVAFAGAPSVLGKTAGRALGLAAGAPMAIQQARELPTLAKEDPQQALLSTAMLGMLGHGMVKDVAGLAGEARTGMGVRRVTREQAAQKAGFAERNAQAWSEQEGREAVAQRIEQRMAGMRTKAEQDALRQHPPESATHTVNARPVIESTRKDGTTGYRYVDLQGKAGRWVPASTLERHQPAPLPKAPATRANPVAFRRTGEARDQTIRKSAKNALYLTNEGMRMVNDATQGPVDMAGNPAYKGETLEHRNADWLFNKLMFMADDPKRTFETRSKAHDMATALYGAMQAGDGQVVLVDAGTGKRISTVRSTRWHEMTHEGLARLTHEQSRRVPFDILADIERHPDRHTMYQNLGNLGYDTGDRHLMAEETIAHLASGDHAALGIDEAKAVDLLARVMQTGIETVGPEWVDVFAASSPRARRMAQEALGRYEQRTGAETGAGQPLQQPGRAATGGRAQPQDIAGGVPEGRQARTGAGLPSTAGGTGAAGVPRPDVGQERLARKGAGEYTDLNPPPAKETKSQFSGKVGTKEEVLNRLRQKNTRDSNASQPVREGVVLRDLKTGKDVLLGRVTFKEWWDRDRGALTDKEFKDARYWYEQLEYYFKRAYGKDAEKYMLAGLASEKNVAPAGGQLNVLRAEDMALRSYPKIFTAGLNEKALMEILRGKIPEGGLGQKLVDFVDSGLLKTTRTWMGDDPRGGRPAVIDVWAARDIGYFDQAFFKGLKARFGEEAIAKAGLTPEMDGVDATRYEYGSKYYNDLTDWLNANNIDGGGWKPHQVQAVGWIAMQKIMGGRMQMPRDIIGGNTRRVAFELAFSPDTPLFRKYGDLSSIPYERADKIAREVLDHTVDLVMQATGARRMDSLQGPGYYKEKFNSSQDLDVMASPETIQDVIDSLGYLLHQDEVWSARPLTTGNRTAFDIVETNGQRMRDPDYVRALWEKLHAADPKNFVGMQPLEVNGQPGIRVIKPTGKWNDAQIKALEEIVAKVADEDLAVRTGHGPVELQISSNDWKVDKNGESYLRRIVGRGRSPLAGRLQSHLGPSVEQRIADAFKRHGGEGGGAAAGTEGPQTPPQSQRRLARTSPAATSTKGRGKKSAPQPPPRTPPGEVATSVWKAGLLTGPATHLRNLGGNAAFQLMEEASRIPASIADMAVSAVRHSDRTVEGANLRAIRTAAQEAATRGMREARQIVRTGNVPKDIFRRPDDVAKELNSKSKLLNTYVNSVFRSLSAEDRVFRVYAWKRSLEAQATLARRRGVTLDPDAAMTQAIADAEFAVFSNDNQVSKMLQGAKEKGTPTGQAVLDFIMPFPKTPTNILARAMEYAGGTAYGTARGALDFATARKMADPAARKAFSDAAQKRFSETFGRGSVGLGIILAGYMLADKGLMTPPAEDWQEAQNANKRRQPPASVLAGGRWWQVGGFSPIGNLLALGAAMRQVEATSPGKRGSEALRAITGALKDQPLLSAGEQLSKLTTPGGSGAAARGYAGSVVPAAVSEAAKLTDRTQRQAQTPLEAVQGRIPGLRNLLPEKKGNLPESWPGDPFKSVPASGPATMRGAGSGRRRRRRRPRRSSNLL